MWTGVGPRKHVGLLNGGAHWRNLTNTIEPSMCGGDVAFLSNYFDHLLLLLHNYLYIICTKSVGGQRWLPPNKPSPPSLWRQRGAGLRLDRTRRSAGRLAAAVTSREPQLRKPGVRLVIIKLRRRLELEQQVVDGQAGLTRAVNEDDYTDTAANSPNNSSCCCRCGGKCKDHVAELLDGQQRQACDFNSRSNIPSSPADRAHRSNLLSSTRGYMPCTGRLCRRRCPPPHTADYRPT